MRSILRLLPKGETVIVPRLNGKIGGDPAPLPENDSVVEVLGMAFLTAVVSAIGAEVARRIMQ